MPGMRSEAGEKSIQLKVRPARVASNNTMATFVAPPAQQQQQHWQNRSKVMQRAASGQEREKERATENVRSRKLHYCVACSQFGQLM